VKNGIDGEIAFTSRKRICERKRMSFGAGLPVIPRQTIFSIKERTEELDVQAIYQSKET